MGAINVQTQMLAAPTALVAEQAVIGLVEHPEQPMTIDIANPGCRHNALVTAGKPLMSKVNGHLVRRASQSLPDIQTLPVAVGQSERAKPAGIALVRRGTMHRVRLSPCMGTTSGVT